MSIHAIQHKPIINNLIKTQWYKRNIIYSKIAIVPEERTVRISPKIGQDVKTSFDSTTKKKKLILLDFSDY